MNTLTIMDKRIVHVSRLLLLPIVIVVLAGSAYTRNMVWQNDIALLEDGVSKSPNKGRVHHNLGRAYDTNRMPSQAFQQYLIATSVDPYLAKAHESLGISYVSMGQLYLARQQFELALRLDPGLQEANMFLAYVLKQNQ